MRATLPLLLLAVGCAVPPDPGTACDAEAGATEAPANAIIVKPSDEIVFRAKYYPSKGPCIRIGDAWAMPVVDGFEVVEVLSGKLPTAYLHVRHGTDRGAGYPEGLVRDKLYTLRLVPSDRTREQLRENEAKNTSDLVYVDADEIAEVK